MVAVLAAALGMYIFASFGIGRYVKDDYFRAHARQAEAVVMRAEKLRTRHCTDSGCHDVTLQIMWNDSASHSHEASVSSYTSRSKPVIGAGAKLPIYYDTTDKFGPREKDDSNSALAVDRSFAPMLLVAALLSTFSFFLIRSSWSFATERGRALKIRDPYKRLDALNALGDASNVQWPHRRRRAE